MATNKYSAHAFGLASTLWLTPIVNPYFGAAQLQIQTYLRLIHLLTVLI